MTDNTGRLENSGNGPPDDPDSRTLRRRRSSPTLTSYSRDFYAPLPPTQPPVPGSDLSRPGSPLESDRDKRVCTTSPMEDPEDPIEDFTQASGTVADDVTHVSASVESDAALSPSAIHAPDSKPNDLTTVPVPYLGSDALTEPSAAFEAAAAAYTSPPIGVFTFSCPHGLAPSQIHIRTADEPRIFRGYPSISPTEPSASYQAAMNAHTTQDGELTPRGPSTPVPVHPETSPSRVPLPLTEGMDVNDDIDPYRAPPMAESRSVSQVPVLPTQINRVPLVIPGRANVNANLLLAAIVKAGGKAQALMSSDPAITHAIALIRGLLDDASGGIIAVTDAVIASGDMEIYGQTTAVRAEFHASLYLILRGLDELTERDREAGLPAEPIPTDNLHIIRSIQDMRESHELDLQLIREEMAKMRGEMKTDGPKSTPVGPKSTPIGPKSTPVGPKSTSGPKSTPKPPPAPAPPAPTTALPKQNPNAPVGPKPKPKPVTFQVIGSGAPVPSRTDPNEIIADWDTITSRIDDEPQPQRTWAELVADEDTPMTGPANLGPVDAASFGVGGPDPDNDDGFTRVEKGKGRAHGERPVRSFAQAARQAPKHPIPNAAKIAQDIRSMGKTATPVRFAASVNTPEGYVRKTPRTMYAVINSTLIRRSAHARVIHADWNEKGRLVLNFPNGSSVDEIEAALPDISKALGFPEDTHYTRCAIWSKVAVSRAATGFEGGEGIWYSEEEILEDITRNNRHIAALTFTYGPRWITRDPDPAKARSTFTFAFKDNANGSSLAAIINKPIYFAGERLCVAKWNDRPLLKGCLRCQDLGHFQRECKSHPRCGVCAGRHITSEHRRHCGLCLKEKRAPNLNCVHPRKCANCGGAHGATHPECPKRAGYRAPIAKSLRVAEEARTDAEESLYVV